MLKLKLTPHIAMRAMRVLAAGAATLAAACGTPSPSVPPAEAGPAASAAKPEPLPAPPWRDDMALAVTSGHMEWTDPSRDRTITAQWTAPAGAAARAVLLVLPGLAQGTFVPPAVIEALAGSGFAVVILGHPGNDATVWQGPEARRADFTQAARRMYAAGEVAERGADVRFALDALDRQPPPWLSPAAMRRVGAVGIGLGSQTLQWMLGETMARGQVPVVEPRIVAAALLGPYVGFEGPGMRQRYGAIVTPLLVAYGLTETDPYGLGMTSQQRRAMVAELKNAQVTELRLPTSSLVGTLVPGGAVAPMPPAGAPAPDGSTMPRGEPAQRTTRNPGATLPGGGAQQGSLLPQRPHQNMPGAPRSAAPTPGDRSARVALLLSVQAFFEARLLGNADAREWLEGPHPGPAQWTTYAAGRPS